MCFLGFSLFVYGTGTYATERRALSVFGMNGLSAGAAAARATPALDPDQPAEYWNKRQT